eukprot:CAMPEP_0118912674 /NCGR_PEP_ID=MMETSP1166-20130328/13810_1 /TAXON_ID=1104430 /ORGANISM="Chrysoreinhardia sp, Strain CCMP3193" /LENGTH=450 /DNA_ID=CAMNT_0006852195 /DNA_START=17 /DNA_END=1369 /DNA_ORIENTATION=+
MEMSPTTKALKARAEAGESRAMLEYGVELLEKRPESGRESLEWFRKCVATAGDDGALKGTACYALGYAYDAGKGIARNDRESARWIAMAAEAGNRQAMELVRKRRRDVRRRRLSDVAVVACLVVFVAVAKTLFELCYVLWHRETFKEEVSGADPSTPSYEWRRDVFPDSEKRAALASQARDLIGLTARRNQPLSESFRYSRGVVAHFRRPAVDDVNAFGSPELKWIRDAFLAEVLDDDCNAFVFNVLVVPPGRGPNRTYGVDFHVDQTLIQSTTQREQTAFTVSVGYVQVPTFIDGGHLEINGLRHHPTAGSVLVFRGDQNHAVAAFCAAAKTDGDPLPNGTTPPRGGAYRQLACPLEENDPDLQRISFVLEQYKLPNHKLKRSPYFILAPSSLEEELIPILSAFPLGPTAVELYLHLRKRLYFPYKRRMLNRSEDNDDPAARHQDVSPL